MKVTLKQMHDLQKDIAIMSDIVADLTKIQKKNRTAKQEADLAKYKLALKGAQATKKYLEDQI